MSNMKETMEQLGLTYLALGQLLNVSTQTAEKYVKRIEGGNAVRDARKQEAMRALFFNPQLKTQEDLKRELIQINPNFDFSLLTKNGLSTETIPPVSDVEELEDRLTQASPLLMEVEEYVEEEEEIVKEEVEVVHPSTEEATDKLESVEEGEDVVTVAPNPSANETLSHPMTMAIEQLTKELERLEEEQRLQQVIYQAKRDQLIQSIELLTTFC